MQIQGWYLLLTGTVSVKSVVSLDAEGPIGRVRGLQNGFTDEFLANLSFYTAKKYIRYPGISGYIP